MNDTDLKLPQQDLNLFLSAIPYARFLNIRIDQKGNEITTVMGFDAKLIGNPVLPALHGGAIGAFLEMTSIIQLAFETGITAVPKPIGLTIDYLRSGKPHRYLCPRPYHQTGSPCRHCSRRSLARRPLTPYCLGTRAFLLKTADE